MSKVLVLNASYEPLNITSWRRATVLLIKGKAERLEHNGKYIYAGFPLPTVIRLRHYVRVPYKDIPLTRRNLLQRDNHTCQYCGYSSGEGLTLDHIIPRSRGGGETWENMVTACVRCNVKKGNRTPAKPICPSLASPANPTAASILKSAAKSTAAYIKNGRNM